MVPFELQSSDLDEFVKESKESSSLRFKEALNSNRVNIRQMAALLSPEGLPGLEALASRSRAITLKRFGKVIQLYTPIYLSNYCQNDCVYCGFRRNNSISRKIQAPERVLKEALYLKSGGFKNILLVSGEDPKVDIPYLTDTVKKLHREIPSISIEVAPRSVDEYRLISASGADGVVIYQETYNRKLYEKYHRAGKKGDYSYRIQTPGRAASAGFHRVGVGVLLGLGDPVFDVLALYTHIEYLLKHFWRTQLTVSFPRIREADGAISSPWPVSDRQFVQIICAMRIAFPDIGIVLSTREEPGLRDGLMKIGVTQMSAGSRTEVGGYLSPDNHKESSQFATEDNRNPKKIRDRIRELGYDPVWKDWEKSLNDKVYSKL